MKYLLLAILTGFTGWTVAQSEGVHFFDGDWNTLLISAQKLDQPIFIDAYTDWCQPCKKMDAEVFPDPEVGAFFNQHFLNVKLDMEKGKGKEIRKKYHVRAYPQFLWIDHDGNLLHKTTGYKTGPRLIAEGKKALPIPETFEEMKARYAAGSLADSLLYSYLHGLQINDEHFGDAFDQYIAYQKRQGEDTLSDRNLTLVFKQLREVRQPEYRFMVRHREIFQSFFGAALDQRLINLFDENVYQAGKANDSVAWISLKLIAGRDLEGYDVRQKLKMDVIFARGNKDWETFFYLSERYAKQFLLDSLSALDQSELERIVTLVNRHIHDDKKLARAQGWMNQSLKVNRNPHKLLLNAELLLHLGKSKKAERDALEARELLKAEGRDLQVAENLLAKIKTERKKSP